MKKKSRNRLCIILGIGIVLLIAAASVLAVLSLRAQREVKKAKAEVQELQKEKEELDNAGADLEEEVATLAENLERAREEAQDAEEGDGEEAGEAEGELSEGEEAEGELSEGEEEEGQLQGGDPMDQYKAGDIIPSEEISPFSTDQYFQSYEIQEGDEVYSRIVGKSYQPDGIVPLSDLRYLKLIHYNFSGNIQVGELIVNAALVEDYISAFTQLFDQQYQIQSMYLVDNYWTGDPDTSDSRSIDFNNTSCFNYRNATGSGNLSQHAYGNAIDINPQQNPYVDNGYCSHENAQEYLDRTSGKAHMITYDDACYKIFSGLGFFWGGDWTNVQDYQHFEKKLS